MRYTLLFLSLLLALLLASCDRFEHSFQPGTEVDFSAELFSPLQEGFNQVTATDLSAAMSFYAEDYLHYGLGKSEWETSLNGIIAGVTNPQFAVSFSSTELQDDANALANWRLIISDPDSKAVLADSLYVGERLVKRDGKWLLKGNQSACVPPVGKQRIIVEYVTNIGCSYCPAVETVLHELRQMYPTQFSYLTHQFSGPVAINDPLYAYYNAYSAPVSIIQGQHKLSSGTQDVIDQYAPLVQSLIGIDTAMNYNVVSANVSGSNLSGSVFLDPVEDGFSQENLVLNLAIIERVSSATSVSGEPLTNVVLARNRIDISTADLSQPVSFDFSDNAALPNDASLVIFVQRTPATFSNNAIIYSGTEIVLTTP